MFTCYVIIRQNLYQIPHPFPTLGRIQEFTCSLDPVVECSRLLVADFRNPLLLNVGFIIHETIGYSREFPFDFESIAIPPDTNLSNLSGLVRVTRTAQGLLVQVKMKACLPAECARCLTEFSQLLQIDFTDLYAFSLKSVTELGLILPENGRLDLAPIVRDEMLLAIPISPLCRPDCKGLCPICGENLNEITGKHEHLLESTAEDA
jgi:uncharacterized protein